MNRGLVPSLNVGRLVSKRSGRSGEGTEGSRRNAVQTEALDPVGREGTSTKWVGHGARTTQGGQ